MRIQSATISDFRNIAHAELGFAPRLTALVGENGQGKTNLVEALYTVAALRPLRSVARGDLIRSGAAQAEIVLDVRTEATDVVSRLGLSLGREGRRLRREEKACEASAFLGVLVCVAFSPDDLELSKGGPEARRRFLDRALFNARPAYLGAALRYAKALKSRTRVLLDEGSDTLLEAFDEALARAGADVLGARLEYVERLLPRLLSTFASIASPAPALAVRYATNLDGADASVDRRGLFELLYRALERRRANDRRRKKTSVGPHLDDLELVLGDRGARARASQGQHRALALALKLSEIALVTETLGEPPVLLLDDISSELDGARTAQLFRTIAPLEGQVVLTTTEPAQVERWSSELGFAARTYRVRSGQFTLDDVA